MAIASLEQWRPLIKINVHTHTLLFLFDFGRALHHVISVAGHVIAIIKTKIAAHVADTFLINAYLAFHVIMTMKKLKIY